jgi:acyl transferase domain-containing protein
LTFSLETFAWLSNMNMLSPDNRSYSFDHRANGYARGEGIAVMIVKRLNDAVRDGNTIRAVIRSTGANEDGHTPGITQPSQVAQEQLMKETYARAGLSMALTRYVEASKCARLQSEIEITEEPWVKLRGYKLGMPAQA